MLTETLDSVSTVIAGLKEAVASVVEKYFQVPSVIVKLMTEDTWECTPSFTLTVSEPSLVAFSQQEKT
jgi:hypothetical protein